MMAEGDDEPTQQAAPQQQYVTIKNPYMLLPPSINFPQQRQKTPVEQNYDMAMFWEVLASDNRQDPTIREIANSIAGKKQ
jgi:hypothetical protein